MQDEFTQNILKEEETINFMQTKKGLFRKIFLRKRCKEK